jgi:hypothetical protein
VSDPKAIPDERMVQRYGTDRSRGRAVVVALSAVVATAFLVWLAWAAWFHSDPAIEAEVVAFDVVDTHETRVRVEAQFRDDRVEGGCLLRATASDHTIVGELNLTVAELREAGNDWIPVRTEREATTVTLVRCTEAD